MKPTIWVFSLEPLETRYTSQWYTHIPDLLTEKLGNNYNVVQVNGIQNNTATTPGAFLNFSDTNYWKSSQLCKFLEHHNRGETTYNDHIIFTDAWNPIILQLKYMKDLLGFNWKLHGLWHAGSYDPQDFLGRIVGHAPWVRNTEKSFFWALDHNYFASEFHIDYFVCNLLNNGFAIKDWSDFDSVDLKTSGRIVRTGWPMEYMETTLSPYRNILKRDLIIFPHRIAPEKQVEIFRDLEKHLPQYEFVVCQDKKLSKHEYHSLLGQAKILFSCSLQETLGISPFEGACLDVIPMVPDRLSYSEMYYDGFKYPSEWTDTWEHYLSYRQQLCHHIIVTMTHYEKRLAQLNKQKEDLSKMFFSADNLLKRIA